MTMFFIKKQIEFRKQANEMLKKFQGFSEIVFCLYLYSLLYGGIYLYTDSAKNLIWRFKHGNTLELSINRFLTSSITLKFVIMYAKYKVIPNSLVKKKTAKTIDSSKQKFIKSTLWINLQKKRINKEHYVFV